MKYKKRGNACISERDNWNRISIERDYLLRELLDVGEYIGKWTGKQNLISCSINIDNTGISKRCHLVYDIGDINNYKGVCEVICCFEDEKWIMKSAEKNIPKMIT